MHVDSRAATAPEHLPVLTAIRGLAAWWVVLFHFKHFLFPYLPGWTHPLISRGDLAVDLFFCLSGFVIYTNYYRLSWSAKGIAAFYGKRLARIYPLHLLFLGLYACLALALVGFSATHRVDGRYGLWALAANLLLVQDWGLAPEFSWNVPGWSISAEFAAYLAFPLLLRTLQFPRASVRRLACAVALALGGVALAFTAARSDLGGNTTSLGVVRCLGQFAAGMVLAEVCRRRRPWMTRHAWVPLTSAVGLFACCLKFDLPTAVAVPPAWACLILGLALDRGPLSKALSAGPLVWGGDISYATYMCHYFVYDVFKLAAVGNDMKAEPAPIAAAFAAIALWSAILYRFVERPCQSRLVKALLAPKPAPARHRNVCQEVGSL